MYVVLVYDIKSQGGGNVTNNVFKICKKFLTHVQNSVFEGDLDKAQYLDLSFQLRQYLRKGDSCIVFSSNNNKWMKKDFLVEEEDKLTNLL
ncbi:MAG: CRISPR-associated endonuclease Cas2 [Christensenellaceae bacterium]|jgi:CRISPR-associated protein Cas2|nr:CRISPR-associated endonuclease Cas2 [Christensenellaceae bacterium]